MKRGRIFFLFSEKKKFLVTALSSSLSAAKEAKEAKRKVKKRRRRRRRRRKMTKEMKICETYHHK
jgi:hypothetical protein